jgi:two-component system KDP operon response regulator KdpE
VTTAGDTPAPRVVIVEDERQIRRFLRTALEAEHCSVAEAGTARQGVIEAGTRRPDLVIVDLGLPDQDGMELIRDIRGWSCVPILILSARSDEADKVAALDAGADDYLTKPFGIDELLARVRALLRRLRHPAGGDEGPLFRFGGIQVDLTTRQVLRDGETVHLTPIEYRLLVLLVTNAGRVLTHRQLLREVWGPSHAEHTHYLRVYMAGLRRKLEADAARPCHLRTESGIGYRLVID